MEVVDVTKKGVMEDIKEDAAVGAARKAVLADALEVVISQNTTNITKSCRCLALIQCMQLLMVDAAAAAEKDLTSQEVIQGMEADTIEESRH